MAAALPIAPAGPANASSSGLMLANSVMMSSASAETGKSCVSVVGVTPASAVSNWLDAASASSGVPPAAMTSLNAVNAVLFVLAALAALLNADAALISAEGSPV